MGHPLHPFGKDVQINVRSVVLKLLFNVVYRVSMNCTNLLEL